MGHAQGTASAPPDNRILFAACGGQGGRHPHAHRGTGLGDRLPRHPGPRRAPPRPVAAALRAYTDLDDDSTLSLGSAARLWSAPLPGWLEEDWRIHLARRRGRSTPRRVNVVGHQLALLPDEVVELDGVRLTSPARTWLDLASVLSADDLVVAGDSMVCEHGRGVSRPPGSPVQHRGFAVHGGAPSGTSRRAEGAVPPSSSSGWAPIRHPRRGCAWRSSAPGCPNPS